MMLVMEVMRESRQDLRRKVGIVSREQMALEDIRMARRTSSWLVGEKVLKERERENIYLFHHNPRTYNNETYCIINSLDYDERATREDTGTYLASLIKRRIKPIIERQLGDSQLGFRKGKAQEMLFFG